MNERNCRSSIRFVNICFEMLFLESFRSRHGRVSEGGKSFLVNFYFLIHYHGERANKFHNAALTMLECSCEKLSWKVFAVFSLRNRHHKDKRAEKVYIERRLDKVNKSSSVEHACKYETGKGCLKNSGKTSESRIMRESGKTSAQTRHRRREGNVNSSTLVQRKKNSRVPE